MQVMTRTRRSLQSYTVRKKMMAMARNIMLAMIRKNQQPYQRIQTLRLSASNLPINLTFQTLSAKPSTIMFLSK